MIPITTPDGKIHKFVIDFAATSTVVSRSILPPDAVITKMEMVEYSAGSATTKKATMQGATGSVDSDVFLGKYDLTNILIDKLLVQNINASVLREFPAALAEMGISGILGTDVLMRSNSLTISGLQNNEGGTITFGSTNPPSNMELSFPLKLAAGLFFVEGAINRTPIQLIVDTGARESILSSSFADKHKLVLKVVATDKQISGIDGVPKNATIVEIDNFNIGKHDFGSQQMILSDMAVLQSFGLQTGSAILGMDFFKRFSEVTFDLKNLQLILSP